MLTLPLDVLNVLKTTFISIYASGITFTIIVLFWCTREIV